MNNDKKVFVDINNAGGRKPLMEKLQKRLDTGEDPFAPEHIAKYHKKPIIKSCSMMKKLDKVKHKL